MEIFIYGSMPKKFDLREGLNVGTVPMLKMHNLGTSTAPTIKMGNIGTVSMFKMYSVGTQIFSSNLDCMAKIIDHSLRFFLHKITNLQLSSN